MAQSLAKISVHLVFSTKLRRPVIPQEVRGALISYMSGILQQLDSPALEIQVMADHVHALFCLSRNCSLAQVVEELKKSSSKWLKSKSPTLVDFYWQAGYGAFGVSESNLGRVRNYIIDQPRHHRQMTFQDEFLALLHRHRINFDERYIWA